MRALSTCRHRGNRGLQPGSATRLGLWDGTSFANAPDFVSKVDAGGVASMELVAQNLKSMGLYGARSLSYDDVTYGQLKHDLSNDQLGRLRHDRAFPAGHSEQYRRSY